MRRTISLAIAALLVALMVAATAAGPAFAAPCPPCPLTANDAAQGDFFTGSTHAIPNSGGKAEEGITNAFMHNVNP